MSNPLDFDHIDTWIFDLDNTLYPPSCNLFALIDVKMGEFIAEFLQVDPIEARRIQKEYFRDYGTTLNGLMHEHNLKPDAYLEFVHDIDHDTLCPNPGLQKAIAALPGQTLVFTNGSDKHAENVLGKLELSAFIDGIHDIRASDFQPKPKKTAYENFVNRFDVHPKTAAMFEDIAVNLIVPDELGMKTVLVRGDGDHPDEGWVHLGNGDEPHVHYMTENLGQFLSKVSPKKEPDSAE